MKSCNSNVLNSLYVHYGPLFRRLCSEARACVRKRTHDYGPVSFSFLPLLVDLGVHRESAVLISRSTN